MGIRQFQGAGIIRCMPDRQWLLGLLLSLTLLGAATVSGETLRTIAFGSCARQQMPQPIWAAIVANKPDLFIFMGDNVYADTVEIERMRESYRQLAAKPGFAKLREQVPILATWDDHDYGENDAGASFVAKADAQNVFLDFFDVPREDPRWHRPGIYSSHLFGSEAQRVQVILLDTRYFRSEPKKRPTWQYPTKGKYAPNTDPAASMLGDAQWAWLEEELRQPARLRLLVSSIQVLPDEHRFEKWANFPRERERLLRLIETTQANGVVLLSGDRHLGDISVLPIDAPLSPGYSIVEVTASGMNCAGAGAGEANRFRVIADNVRVDHFGLIDVDWTGGKVRLGLADVEGKGLASYTVSLEALTPSKDQ